MTPEPLTFTEKQATFIEKVVSGDFRYLAFGGGIRGGKSFAGIGALILLCRIFPGSRWAIVRKDLPTIRRNTIPSFEKLRPPDFMEPVNGTTWTSKCTNGSELLFFPEALKEDRELNRWRGLEVNGFLLEEGNECSERSFFKALERAGSWIVPNGGKQPPPLILATFNPNDQWPRRVWYEPYMGGTLKAPYYYLPATIFDNPHIPQEYLTSLESLPPEEYERFVKGRWDTHSLPNQLIKAEWIWSARNVEPDMTLKRRLGVDVARYGDDQTVLTRMMGGQAMISQTPYRDLSTDAVADLVTQYASDPLQPVEASEVRVDGVGLGSGTVDVLRRLGWKIRDVQSGAAQIIRPKSVFQFKNLRAQMWWEFREKLRLGLFSLPTELDERLISDLTAVRYEIKGDKEVEIWSKDKIKLETGRSTDWGDSLVYGAFDFPEKRAVLVTPSLVEVGSPYSY